MTYSTLKCLPHNATDIRLIINTICCCSVTQLFVTSWTAARHASLSITISWSLLKLMFTELMMLSNHLILCRPLLLLPSIFPSIRVFSNESAHCIRWPKYWNLSFSWRLTHVIAKAFRFCIQSSNSPAYQLSGLGQVS